MINNTITKRVTPLGQSLTNTKLTKRTWIPNPQARLFTLVVKYQLLGSLRLTYRLTLRRYDFPI